MIYCSHFYNPSKIIATQVWINQKCQLLSTITLVYDWKKCISFHICCTARMSGKYFLPRVDFKLKNDCYVYVIQIFLYNIYTQIRNRWKIKNFNKNSNYSQKCWIKYILLGFLYTFSFRYPKGQKEQQFVKSPWTPSNTPMSFTFQFLPHINHLYISWLIVFRISDIFSCVSFG